MNFKEIHIGSLLQKVSEEREISIARICRYMNLTEEEVYELFESKSLDSEKLLMFSKLLEYDFFRLYTQHLILYAPLRVSTSTKPSKTLPSFRKNIYTKEIINFILEQVRSERMTAKEVIDIYGVPKTTLYKWLKKYEISYEKV